MSLHSHDLPLIIITHTYRLNHTAPGFNINLFPCCTIVFLLVISLLLYFCLVEGEQKYIDHIMCKTIIKLMRYVFSQKRRYIIYNVLWGSVAYTQCWGRYFEKVTSYIRYSSSATSRVRACDSRGCCVWSSRVLA